jgi:hypothetical protein|tara:strand:- start:269 stop:418 length:150 start_codon:yes stop_codon:yes gene_type:complete
MVNANKIEEILRRLKQVSQKDKVKEIVILDELLDEVTKVRNETAKNYRG